MLCDMTSYMEIEGSVAKTVLLLHLQFSGSVRDPLLMSTHL